MAKNISSLLQKGNLTPKERYLLLIQNDVIRGTTGKEPLTEADKKGLVSWRATTDSEAREWNRYNEGWKLSGRAGLEAEMIYLETKADHFRKFFINLHLNFYPLYREARQLLGGLEKIKIVDAKEAIEIIQKQREQKLKDGLDFDDAIYQLAFESLSEDLRKDILALCPEAKTETDYLDQEEIIADLFNGKDELTKEAKEKLAELIANEAYNFYAKEYQLYHYFADIPILEVARRWATEKGLKPTRKYGEREKEALKKVAEEEKMSEDEVKERLFLEDELKDILENYARDNKTTTMAILKEVCLKWLDDGLLVNDYTPLFNSDHKHTINETDTKLSHKEVFKEWLKAKTEAEATLKNLINKGELKAFEIRPQDGIVEKIDINNEPEGIRVITGESLYNFQGDYEFIKHFKERADEYDPDLRIVYADNDPEHKGEHLDQELLIANKNKTGGINIFSSFGITTNRLKQTFQATQFIKETEKDGEVILDFDNETLKDIFKEIRESLINGYATLLAFREVLKRLSKTYEADLTFILNKRVESVSDFIDQHNKALSMATGQKLHGGEDNEEIESWIIKRRGVLKMKDDLFIDKGKILPDINTQESWNRKFEDILGDDF